MITPAMILYLVYIKNGMENELVSVTCRGSRFQIPVVRNVHRMLLRGVTN